MTDQTITRANRLRGLLGGGAPPIAVSFADNVDDSIIEQASDDGLDIFELRIDRYSSTEPQHVLDQVKRFAEHPTIATIRTQDEGGEWDGPDADRLALFELVLPEVDAIDIELLSTTILADLVALAKAQDKVVIISNHNFELTPSLPELMDVAGRARDAGADLVKLSAMTHSHEDLRVLAKFLVTNDELGLIVIGMGGHGSLSRVAFPALGSQLTYAYAYANRPVSGQLTYDDTFAMLRKFYPEFNQKKMIELEILDPA